MVPAAKLEAMGYRIGIYPSQTLRAAIRAAQDALKVLKEDGGDMSRFEARMASFADREEAVDTKRWRALEQKYLG